MLPDGTSVIATVRKPAISRMPSIHAEVDRQLQRGDFIRALSWVLRQAPGALTKDPNRFAARQKGRSKTLAGRRHRSHALLSHGAVP
jgi:hypothetical protein